MDSAVEREFNPPSVVVFASHYPPHAGGLEYYTQSLWTRVAALGRTVHVCTCNTEGLPPVEVSGALSVWRFPFRHTTGDRYPLLLPSTGYRRYAARLRERPPGVIVTNTRFFQPSWVGARLARRLGVPHLHIEHGSGYVVSGNPLIDLVARTVDDIQGRRHLRSATRCLAPARQVKAFVERLAGRECGLLMNAVDTAFFSPGPSDFRERHGLPDLPIVACVGRLYREKGVLDLLQAWDLLPRGRAHLVIAGKGPLEGELRALLAGRGDVTYAGSLDRDALRSLLRAACILVNPTYCSEAVPTVILEGGAAGCCVISSDAGGSDEAIRGPELGYIVPARDVPRLAACLSEALADPDLRASKGARLRERMRSCFDWGQRAEEACRVLDELAAAARESPAAAAAGGWGCRPS